MKKFTKIFIVLLAMLTLVACGSDKPSGDSDELTTIVMYLPGDPASNHDDIVEAVNVIAREEINAELDLKFVNWGEWGTKANLWLSTGEEGIDIVTTGGLGDEAFVLNAEKGSLTDITELAKEFAPDALEILHPAYLEATTVNGKMFGIAANANVYGEGILAVNGVLLEKYDLSIEGIEDLEGLIPLLEVIKENEPSVTPYWLGDAKQLAGLEYMISDALPFAIDLYGDHDEVINPYTHPTYVENIKKVRKVYLEGLTNDDPGAVDFPWASDVWFVNQTETGPSDYETYILETVSGRPIEMISLQEPVIDKTHALMSTMVIPKNSKNAEKALEFINLMFTNKDVMTTLGYGVEGENWVKVDGDKLEKTEDYDAGKAYSPWNYGNKMNMYQDVALRDDQIASVEAKLETAIVSPLLGFVVDTDSIKSELANIQNVMEKYTQSIHQGIVDTDDAIEKMQSELDEAGFEKVMEEIKAQYAEYR
ncbi:MAG TPA: ABC transporter substrate-binding protein, partial [Erysipelothrix sp.]|nr:ABC transporter substrate-binding protein [Erysipelothrix sp.]